MSKWIIQRKGADYKGLSEKLKVDQVIVRLMVNRGMENYEEMEEFLRPSLERIPDPHLLKDMDKACSLLRDAINEGKKIRVVGDYDVDGIMSTYILVTAIKRAGGKVDFALPHRITDGYGINPDMVQAAKDAGVDLIITCDNGIAASPAVDVAKELGMTFVVTDHHDVPFDLADDGVTKIQKLPKADAVVDPKRDDSDYPFKEICGAQVAWKLTYCLYELFGIDKSEADALLQFASIATVCDVMPLDGENRATVYHGLKALSATTNPGLRALIARTNLAGKDLNCYNIGFVIGPCFNASGRLDTAQAGVDLLMEEDYDQALAMANELVELNAQRKAMTEKGIEMAKEIMENSGMAADRVLVIYIPSLHESLAGIVAGRIKEEYYRPTFVITDSEGGAKGSGRSIPSYNMFEKLSQVKDIFTKFGGHPMAAGISLPKEKIDELRIRLNENCNLTDEDLEEEILIDCDMPLDYITEDLVDSISLLEPYGTGNSRPVFALKDVRIKRASYMGKESQFLRLSLLTESGKSMTGLLFRKAKDFEDLMVDRFGKTAWEGLFSGRDTGISANIIYQPSINEFRGKRSLQIIIDNFC
ncbi:MAG: single-stranded-DNA-specific exonuclease RecJ [Pseudobutyrivibrio sp.]|nr:single-stranded-DNA-specific exonuclease RecJ [Pseudobutyrivibrio sp.]